MSETIGYINHLSREIGPRPAGTEEERQAAEYIASQIEHGSGLEASVEDFNAPAGNDAPHAICMGVAVVAGVFSLFSPVFGIPAIILLAIVSALLIAEFFDKPLISKLLSRGASQNVVAKYEPSFIFDEGRGRKRKIVIVSRYDSGKVRNELSPAMVKALPIVQRVSFWSVPALFVLVFIRSILLGGDTGALGSVFAFLVVVGVILSLIPVVLTLLHKVSPYNEAANANAAGVAVMMEVAGRVGRGRMSEEEIAFLNQYEQVDENGDLVDQPEIHGEAAAIAAGVVPEDVEIRYEAEPTVEEAAAYVPATPTLSPEEVSASYDEDSAAGRLMAAKAAIAAMTGAAVSSTAYVGNEEVSAVAKAADSAANAVAEEVAAPAEAVDAVAEAAEEQPFAFSTAQPSAPSVPDWFAAAQARAKANKPAAEAKNVKRSRYADALDAAVSASSAHFEAANQQALTGMDDQISQLNDGIVAVPAPGFEAEPTQLAAGAASESASADEEAAAIAEPVVGRADNDILSGVVESIEDTTAEFNMAMPSFLEDERFTRPMEPVRAADERVSVDAFAEAAEPEVPEETAKARDPFDLPLKSVEPVEPVSDFVGQITSDFAPVSPEEQDSPSLSKRLPGVLPETTGSFKAISDIQQQRAPLADSTSKGTAQSLLSMLPSIDTSSPSEGAGRDLGALRMTLPTMSGSITAVTSTQPNTGSAGATGVFAPVTDDLVKAAKSSDEDLFIEDADDSDYQENFTESGAFAGPDYVEMPKSPVRSFFDKIFHRKDAEPKQVAMYDDAQWDDAYDEYGDDPDSTMAWDSSQLNDEYAYDDAYDDGTGKWNGGALSALKNAASTVGDKASQAAHGVADKAQGAAGRVRRENAEDAAGDSVEPAAPEGRRRGRFSSMVDDADFGYDSSPRAKFEEEQRQAHQQDSVAVEAEAAEGQPEEMPQIQAFRNPFVNAEVWFVALGSELAGNAGMRAFLSEHASELRGSIIIELDALGEGRLSLVETEGSLKKVPTSSRMKRYMRKVAQATGITCSSAHFDWNDSAASYANSHGFNAMHLVGEAGGKPALFAQDNDVIESIDEQTLEANVECVMELLRTI